MSAPYIDHIVSRLRADVSFLRSQNQISAQDAELILAKLPSPGPNNNDSNRAVDDMTRSFSNLSVPDQARAPAPARKPVPSPAPKPSGLPRAKALWTYTPDDPADLSFREDDIIEIVEEVNDDWWKGRVGGKTGLFPANYVEKLPGNSSPQPPAYTLPVRNLPPRGAEPKQGFVPPPGPPPGQYQQPQYQQPYQYQSPPPQQYPPPPPPQQYQPPMVPQPAPAPAPAQPSRFGGLGQTMATAAAGGLGWGAGAAIGGDLINSIF